ncbi:nuclear receptor subfamily 5, group A, member 5 [Amia ocellicauda]|uniref:nuclear receptor subfamily 5, group A, member 5 n=1 Tax=Amia ocellicauda TaxID=2972642 RepID=UPI0034646129
MSDFPSDLPTFLPGDLGPDWSLPSENPSTSLVLKRESAGGAPPREGCPICGDRVSGYHYGLLTCESCKGFFKRTVQNDKRYTCPERQNCPVDTAHRKRCPSCRFQKCLRVGMRREAVRADRMRGGRNKFGPLYRRDRQMKLQRHAYESSTYVPKQELPAEPHSLVTALQAVSATAAHPLHIPPLPPPLYGPSQTDAQTPGLSLGQREVSGLQDCSSCPSIRDHPIHSSYHPPQQYDTGYPGFSPAKAEMYPYASLPAAPQLPPCPPAPPPSASPGPGLLSELLRWEPEEPAMCARVLSSLQRERASRGKHDRLNTFGIMCKMADLTLLGLVEWARSCPSFKELQVEDQMALLQGCWSELLVLDHLFRQVAHGKEDSIYLVTGQQIDVSTVLSQAGDTLSSLVSRGQDLASKLRTLQLDRQEFMCLKYLVLFNPDAKAVREAGRVETMQERVNRALMEHTVLSHPRQADKFGQLLLKLPEVRSLSLQVEEYLYRRHLHGDLPCNSLLTEMLHTRQD